MSGRGLGCLVIVTAMVESPRIATVKHVVLATAADALVPISSAVHFPRGIIDPHYRQTKGSTPSRVALRSGAKYARWG